MQQEREGLPLGVPAEFLDAVAGAEIDRGIYQSAYAESYSVSANAAAELLNSGNITILAEADG